MSNDIHPANSNGNGGYERKDIGVAGVLYFLLGLAVAGLFIFFLVDGIYSYLDKRSEAEQAPVNPLVTNAPVDTRHIPKEYNGDYEKFLKRTSRPHSWKSTSAINWTRFASTKSGRWPPTATSIRTPAPSASRSTVPWT